MSVEQWRPLVDEVAGLLSPILRPWLRPALLATIAVESGGDARAQGAAGEVGLTQILPATAIALGWEPAWLWEPRENLRAAKKLLVELYGQMGGRMDAVAASYNCGSAGREPRCYPTAYVNRWLGEFQRYGGDVGSSAGAYAQQPTAPIRTCELEGANCTWNAELRECQCGETITVTGAPLELAALPSWLPWLIVGGGLAVGLLYGLRD